MDAKRKWYEKGWVLWALLIIVPYIGVPFMWIIKKEFSKKRKIIISTIFIFWALIIFGIAGSGSDNAEIDNLTPPISEVNKNEETNAKVDNEEESKPEMTVKDRLQESIEGIVSKNKGELISIEIIDLEDSDEISIIAAISCENNEDVVNIIIDEIKDVTISSDLNVGTIITFGDIKKGENPPVLLMAAIHSDGTVETTMESSDYNTARNNWIKNQFSAWDGSHNELKKLIVKNLNDEKSFKHIETTYIDVNSDERMKQVNNILSEGGYKQRVEIEDLFVFTQFSAKNAFGGTVKNTAYGVVSYGNQTITLIGIE